MFNKFYNFLIILVMTKSKVRQWGILNIKLPVEPNANIDQTVCYNCDVNT